jgi:arginase
MATNRLEQADTPPRAAPFAAPAVARSSIVVAVPSGVGAKDKRCGDGPTELLEGGLIARLAGRGIDVTLGPIVFPVRGKSAHGVVAELGGRLAREVSDVLDTGHFPLVLGGDHSCAIGTWSGVAAALATTRRGARHGCGDTGLVWIDAHMDSHTPATSWTGRVHGMPLAALLGHGAGSLPHDGPLRAPNVCLVGIRSYEPEEAALLSALGVRVFDIAEVERRGLAAVLDDAVEIATAGTAGYGFSIDLDAVDPGEAPGVGTPVEGGLAGGALVEALRSHARDPSLVALEIVEYNPRLDRGARTAALVEELIAALLSPMTDA